LVTNLKALEIFAAQSLCDLGILLSVVSFLLHMGRPYFERILARMTLRVGAELWWLAYLVLRDGTLLVAALLGFLHLNLDLMADIKVGLPFVPLATVAMVAALVVKTFGSGEDLNRVHRLGAGLVSLGAVLNVLGYVLVMEGPGGEYPAAKSTFWQILNGWRSNANPELATTVFYLCWSLLGALALVTLVRGFWLLRAPPKDARRGSNDELA
jgi:hypothetical protein